MQIPSDEYWLVHLAALWIATRSPDARKAVLCGGGDGIGPSFHATIWLKEHEKDVRDEFRIIGAEEPINAAFRLLIRAAQDGRITLYDPDRQPLDLRKFAGIGAIRERLEHDRFGVLAHEVVALWPEKPLSDREQAARTFLGNWFAAGKPRWGARDAAIRHVAATCCVHCGSPFEAAKRSTGGFITEEIRRFREASGKVA